MTKSKLAEKLKSMGVSQMEAAVKSKTHPNQLGLYCRGVNPSYNTAKRIAIGVGFDVLEVWPKFEPFAKLETGEK